MTSIRGALPKMLERFRAGSPDGAPESEFVVRPTSLEDLAATLTWASEHGRPVLPWGGGTHQGYGARPDADMLILLDGLDEIVAYEPEDLTVVVEAGVPVAALEDRLAERGQTAVLPERAGAATVGGVLAAGVSGWRRARYGPSRDRILEATLATGDGRLVTGGGRVVKNVTGYDLPRLAVGSFGALGVIGRVCLKVWPLPSASATIAVDDPARAVATAFRPLAVLETHAGARVYLAGTEAEVEAQAAGLGGVPEAGLHWPEPPVRDETGSAWSLRVPPSDLAAAVDRLPAGRGYVAQHGVGEVTFLARPDEVGHVIDLRSWAEALGGACVLVDGPGSLYEDVDPWGHPPSGLELQRRLVARFDPDRIVNRGRLPGGL